LLGQNRFFNNLLGQLGIQANVEKIVDLDGISSYGVMRTPGLVIDEELVWQGGVPTVDKIKGLVSTRVKVS
jgi:hypothetical protein